MGVQEDDATWELGRLTRVQEDETNIENRKCLRKIVKRSLWFVSRGVVRDQSASPLKLPPDPAPAQAVPSDTHIRLRRSDITSEYVEHRKQQVVVEVRFLLLQ